MSELTPIIHDSFVQYSGAVLQSRALADVRDCLKPSARQIFYCLYTDDFISSKPFKKTLKAIGSAMRVYIHGDSSCEGVIMRAGQPFAMRYPLVEVEGSFGNLMESANWAAPRYTASRLSKASNYLFQDLKKNTITEWRDNYDDTEQYPSVLPSKGYFNIVNGVFGIGIGMGSSIPQFNINDVNNALITLLNNSNCDFEEIYCPPDFATGAYLLNEAEVKESLKTGKGKACKLRSAVEYDSNEHCFIVKEIPYGVYTNTICGELEEILNNNNPGIDRFNDLTSSTPEIKIYLLKNASPSKVLKYLYKNTSLQSHYSINLTMLKDGRFPRVFTWKEILQEHINHEKVVYRRGFEYDLNKIIDRIHIIEGLLICIANIDEVVEVIRASSSSGIAAIELQKRFNLDKVQTKAILDIKLARLAKLEVQKLIDEKNELEKEANKINKILNDESLFNQELINGWRKVASEFGDERRTKIANIELDEEEEPVDLTKYTISVTNKGKIISTKSSTLYAHKRGATGKKNKLSDGEYIIGSFSGMNGDNGVFLSKKGIAYSVKFEELISQDKTYLSAICDFEEDDELKACINIPKKSSQKEYIIFVTKHGYIKKSELSEYRFTVQKGVRALALEDGDEVVSILLTNNEDIGILTHKGMFIITQTSDIRAIGRTARGVVGIKLGENDYVVSSRIVCDKTNQLLFVMENGNGYKIDQNTFSAVGRGAKGRNISNKKDFAIDFLTINENIDIMIISNEATVVINTKDISSVKAIGATGVKLINLKEKSKIKKVEKVTF